MEFPEFIIYGASHVGIQLANRLASARHRVLVIDRLTQSPEPPFGWRYQQDTGDVPPFLDQARCVYTVFDDEQLNIRMILALRSVSKTLPIITTLIQKQLGKKLARHIANLEYVIPPELAAHRFVDSIYQPPLSVKPLPNHHALSDPETSQPWIFDPLILRALSIFILIATSSTVYFKLAEHLSWINAAYFVVTVMTTTGFGDITLLNSSAVSKVIGILLMLTSLTLAATIFALITDSLLKKRLELSLGRRRVTMSRHIIVIGAGTVGAQTVEKLLDRGETVVSVDSQVNGRFVPSIVAKGVPVIIGDAKLERTLLNAGLMTAKALISVTNHDLTNLEVGLNARILRPDLRVVLRVYDQQLAQSLKDQLDIQFAFGMSSVAAEVLAQAGEKTPVMS